MSRHTQPAVITVICDGCGAAAPPDEGLGLLVRAGWDVSFDEPSGCDWCPMCTRTRSDLNAAIQRVRELHHPTPGFNGSLWCGAHCEATADGDPTEYPCETIRALDGAK